MTLSGYEAIEYAETHGVTLNKYSDPIEDARDGLTPDEAREVAREDPRLIYIVTDKPWCPLCGTCHDPGNGPAGYSCE